MADQQRQQPAGLRLSVARPPLAAVAFVTGLVGLLVANLLLGPLAIVTGCVAVRRDATRRGRAALAIALGVLDVVVFLLLAVHSGGHNGRLSWNFFGH
jgi:hypothetical protein